MSEQLALDQNELTEAQTHINLIQKAYRKLESAQYAARELENDFRDLINVHIQQKGGDPNLQYTLNTDSGALDVVSEEQQQELPEGGNPDPSNNGTQPSSEEVDPTGNFTFGDETSDSFQDGDVKEV